MSSEIHTYIYISLNFVLICSPQCYLLPNPPFPGSLPIRSFLLSYSMFHCPIFHLPKDHHLLSWSSSNPSSTNINVKCMHTSVHTYIHNFLTLSAFYSMFHCPISHLPKDHNFSCSPSSSDLQIHVYTHTQFLNLDCVYERKWGIWLILCSIWFLIPVSFKD